MVCVIGAATWDELVEVVHVPERGMGSSCGRVLREVPGGAGATAAAWVCATGRAARLVCGLGADQAGEQVATACLQRGIEMLVSPCEQTAHRTMMVDGNGTSVQRVNPDPHQLRIRWEALGAEPLSGASDLAFVDVADADDRARAHERCLGRRVLPAEHAPEEAGPGRRWTYVVGSVEDFELLDAGVLEAVGARGAVLDGGRDEGRLWLPWRGWTRISPSLDADSGFSTQTHDAFVGGALAALDIGLALADAARVGARCADACSFQDHGWPFPGSLLGFN